jgi:hypothetical protein
MHSFAARGNDHDAADDADAIGDESAVAVGNVYAKVKPPLMIVPTRSKGMQPVTLCVTAVPGIAPIFRMASLR